MSCQYNTYGNNKKKAQIEKNNVKGMHRYLRIFFILFNKVYLNQDERIWKENTSPTLLQQIEVEHKMFFYP